MPRIEIHTPKIKQPDGAPTVDVCSGCATLFIEAECLSAHVCNGLQETSLIAFCEHDTVGSVNVEHPPYEKDVYDCDLCGNGLREYDN